MNGQSTMRELVFDLVALVSLVCQTEHLRKGCRGSDLLNEINNYLKYNSNSAMDKFRPLLEPGHNRLSPFLNTETIFSLTYDRILMIPINDSKAAVRSPPTRSVGNVSQNETITPSRHYSTQQLPIDQNNTTSNSTRSPSTGSNSNRANQITTQIEPDKYEEDTAQISSFNNSLTEAEKNESEHKTISKRKEVKQWLFALIREFKTQGDKDGGVRHQKVDQYVNTKYGQKNFNELCIAMGYNSVEHFLLHCGAPQIKLAKHKTTGKGATKTGEWVFQEHDYYEGQNEIINNKIPDKYLLPPIGFMLVPLRIADNTTKFRQLPYDESTENFCKTRASGIECEVSHVPPAPVLNCFQIQLSCDHKKYYNPMFSQITRFYGPNGPNKDNSNYNMYRMIPESLRMGLPVVVWMPSFKEWYRCSTVTPTANKKDFTVQLMDFGNKENVKVENCCFMHEDLVHYPKISRECKLFGVLPKFGDSFTKEAYNDTHAFFFDRKSQQPLHLHASFVQMTEGRAFIILQNKLIENDHGEPLTIQHYLNKRKHIKLDATFHILTEGSLDDSVSQNPNILKDYRPKDYRKTRTNAKHQDTVALSKHCLCSTPYDGQPITCSGDQMRQNGVSREDPRRDAKDPRSRQESEYGLASFQPTISAKEKTGVDPLSQVSMPLNKIKGQIDILQTEGMNPSHPNASRVRSSISGSWTDHKNRPLKTVGPAETLTRGTLQPPTQVSPAAVAAFNQAEQVEWTPMSLR